MLVARRATWKDCADRSPHNFRRASEREMQALAVVSPPTARPFLRRCHRLGGGPWRGMVQAAPLQGPAAAYAREMERLSAKESLLLAFKDAGGFQSLVSGKTTEMHKIDVTERIVGLERLNPTPRPTTSPFLEGRWNIEWFGDASPPAFVSRILFERSPSSIAQFQGLDLQIMDGYSKVTAKVKFLDRIGSQFLLTSRLSIEGPTRMKEEYVEGLIVTPAFSEETLPEQLKGALQQASAALQQLPAPIRDITANGLTLPLNGTYQRMFMISYLDEEILIIRDSTGAPDVLTKLEGLSLEGSEEQIITEYES